MRPSDDLVIERPSDLRADWLTAAVGAGTVTDFTFERIGTGQMSETYRVALCYADDHTGPDSVVLKVAATDASSRQTGLTLGLYEREVRFYTDIAPRLSGAIAPCYHAAFGPETGAFHLLLGDAAPAVVGDEIRGTTVEQAMLALAELGRVHGPLLGDAELANAEWLNRESPMDQALISTLWAGFVERYGSSIAPGHREVCEQLVASFDANLAEEAAAKRIQGLVHGDYRLDNMLFGRPGADRPLTVVDWQTVTWGPAFTDVAYFLGCALGVQDRRDHYDALLRAYHEALGPQPPVTLDDVREGVRRQSFFGVMMAIVSAMLVERTERGDEMFMTILARHCDHVLDTGALDVLPAARPPEPLQPTADDEGVHAPGDEELWNESWYFDFADAGQNVGGWVRLGLTPNQGNAWINAMLSGPDMPTIAVLDFNAPLPDDPFEAHSDTANLAMTVEEPLRSWRVRLRGRGEAFDDPTAMTRGETGSRAELTMDLTWTSVGTPYLYRITTRYEIACRVSGVITVDGREFTLRDVPGQRDHSWGVRDWWSMDWVWSASQLDDGTRMHGLDLRVPGMPPMSVGYVQPPDGALTELTTVRAEETFDDNNLPVTTTLFLAPGNAVWTVDPRGITPLRLASSDGRMTNFPRAWAAITTSDGRTGCGWLEWNCNLR